ncbi:nucleotide-diphospho-sugar transferase [Hymenopellis radicata]|nr:nucleotide-diphospho-sugar transferase [Hymenopellis radicata]
MSPRPEYRFTPTQDWFSGNIDSWRLLFQHLQTPEPRILEIGSWEGRSAVFLLTELCQNGGSLTAIDHFDLMQTADGRAREEKLRHNLQLTGRPFRVIGSFSVPALMLLLEEEMSAAEPGFDWVYIDGSHRADDTLLDGELVWRLAREGAVVIFDDYHWPTEEEGGMEHPRRGIDAFLHLHEGEFERLSDEENYQLVLRKLTPMRIGFLTQQAVGQGTVEETIAGGFEYGMNLALAVDDKYAMPAAVAISSAIKHIQGRCTIYIYDCGLSEAEREKLDHSVERAAEGKGGITHKFLKQDKEDLSFALGPVWAKLDLLKRLPVERALYLDADVLIRENFTSLWREDLGGRSIGAVRDAGFPDGHEGIGEGGYFNAGVLLLDLAKARLRIKDLWVTAQAMTESTFKDQDCLNVHFAGDWMELDVRYNAQGQGTYAKAGHQCTNPVIVHFTGPVSPSVGIVLNPWVQPYTAKPWGYAEALEDTAWRGLRVTESFKERRALEKELIIKMATEELDRVLACTD